MSPLEKKVEMLEQRVSELEAERQEIIGRIYFEKDIQINGNLYAEKVYSKTSGSFVELTT